MNKLVVVIILVLSSSVFAEGNDYGEILKAKNDIKIVANTRSTLLLPGGTVQTKNHCELYHNPWIRDRTIKKDSQFQILDSAPLGWARLTDWEIKALIKEIGGNPSENASRAEIIAAIEANGGSFKDEPVFGLDLSIKSLQTSVPYRIHCFSTQPFFLDTLLNDLDAAGIFEPRDDM